MKTSLRVPAIAALAVLLGGCLPEEFVWWSPDGQTVAIRTDEGLRLAGADGGLSGIILTGAIQSVAWLPDGQGLVVNRSLQQTNWATVESLIPPEEAAATRELARAMPGLFQAGLAVSQGSLEEIDTKFLTPLGLTNSEVLGPAVFCALDLHREAMLASLDGLTNAVALQAELLSAATNGIPVHEIVVLSLGEQRAVGAPRALVRSVRPLRGPICSLRHSIVAFCTGDGVLKAVTADRESRAVVADRGVIAAAWSANGRALVHVMVGDSENFGEIRTRTVADDRGGLLAEAPSGESLAMAAFGSGGPPRLAMLPDGRLLFASVPITLPARPASINPSGRFYLLDPARPDAPPSSVEVKEGSLPDDLSVFALSPDGRFVAVVESATDAVAVLELATGKIRIISPAHDGWKARLIPAWRSARELCFAALPLATAARPELILWAPDAPERVLSKAWPDGVVRPWLEGSRSDSEPASK